MSSFTQPLTVTKISSQKWKVERSFEFYLDTKDGPKVHIPIGYETDFASVPRMFWGLFPPATGNYVQAAVIHDYLTEGGPIYEGGVPRTVSFTESNDIFLQAMEVLKTPWYQRYPIYWATMVYSTLIRPLL
jgi:hypothetical protein